MTNNILGKSFLFKILKDIWREQYFHIKVLLILTYITDMRITLNVMLMFAFGVYCKALYLNFLGPSLTFSPKHMTQAGTVSRHTINKVCLLLSLPNWTQSNQNSKVYIDFHLIRISGCYTPYILGPAGSSLKSNYLITYRNRLTKCCVSNTI